MLSKYSSKITHARISSSLNSVSLSEELKPRDTGDPSTRNRRAVTRTVNTILKLAKDLPPYEGTDNCLLPYLRMAVQNVEFSKTARLTSIADKNTTFEELNLSNLTAAQLDDSFKKKQDVQTFITLTMNPMTLPTLTKKLKIYLGNILSIDV